MLIQALGALLTGLSITAGGAAAKVKLVDDRGEPLATRVQACFQIDLRQDCVSVTAGSELFLPSSFQSGKIEGADYGPLSLRDVELGPQSAAARPIRVPRKASLELRSRGTEPTALSLYALDDSDLRRPAHRIEIPHRGALKVPAGEFLASLVAPGLAPDLHVVELAPGGRHQLRFEPRPGWSLVLRTRDSATVKPVAGALVALERIPGYAASSSPPPAARTERHGLALFSGLTDAMMQATVRRAGYVVRKIPGLLASPGSFAYQDVGLETGGRVRATIRLEGQPAAAADCTILKFVRHPVAKSPPPEIISHSLSDAGGICITQQLATGHYLLRVSVPARSVSADKEAEVAAGEETELQVDLSPIRLHGTVRLGARPAPGFRIAVFNDDAVIPRRGVKDVAASGTTDEEGEYETTLWSAGDYSLALTSPQGAPATAKRRQLESPDEEVDFQLDDAAVTGLVVDQMAKPVQGAAVMVRWKGPESTETRIAVSSSDGTFSFPMITTGPVTLQAHLAGYRSTEPLPMEFVSGATLGPVKLVLRKEKTVRGVVTNAAGAPVAQVWVASYTLDAGEFARKIAATVTAADGSFELQIPENGAARFFVSGPGCPLAAVAVATPEQEAQIRCAVAPSALGVLIKDREGSPLTQASLILRRNGAVIPQDAIATHLALLQMPGETDGSGRLVLAGLAPGDYDVFLAGSTSEGLASLGTAHGFLGSFSLAPLALTEVDVQVGWNQPIVESVPH
jgi:Carboxypeptidase regulatory-like domain